MRRIFFVTALLILCAHVCFAASTLNRSEADSQARQSFTLRSVEGSFFDVRIVGDGETILTDWLWALDETIYAGDYSAYLGAANSDTFTRQDVELFADSYGEHPQRINATRDNRDGFCKVTGVNNLPDLLVSKIQVTGGGYFEMKVFAVKNGRLQAVQFLGRDKKSVHASFNTISTPVKYLDNGTLSIPWHTNAAPEAGTYETVCMFDADNLILIPAYTNKL